MCIIAQHTREGGILINTALQNNSLVIQLVKNYSF